jgi:nucleoside-diphosphate-sugar epimerase
LGSPDSRNVYDGAKLISEALAAHASTAARPVVVARLGNVYGSVAGRPAATAFTTFVAQARRGRRIIVSGPPDSTRNHVHPSDAADGLLRALLFGRPGEAYNIGSHDHLTNENFARRVAEAAPFPVSVELANAGARPDHMIISIEKAQRELGFSPARHIVEGLPSAVRKELEGSS